jgi:deazaflavin-dependent oxidoreductase (nitroreductase family)
MQVPFHVMYRLFGDRMRVQGLPLIELETIGARSGTRRRAVLGSFSDTVPNSWIVVASGAGSARHPAGFLNLAKHPDQVWITIGKRRVKVTPETLEGAEREQAWQRIVSRAPGYGRYQEKTDRKIPIARLRQAAG